MSNKERIVSQNSPLCEIYRFSQFVTEVLNHSPRIENYHKFAITPCTARFVLILLQICYHIVHGKVCPILATNLLSCRARQGLPYSCHKFAVIPCTARFVLFLPQICCHAVHGKICSIICAKCASHYCDKPCQQKLSFLRTHLVTILL